MLWAAYPASTDDLSGYDLVVTSIYGTLDGLATGNKIDASRPLLPAGTRWVAIEGGNHAQFGDYGPQAGDNQATITAEEQQAQAAAATIDVLEALAGADTLKRLGRVLLTVLGDAACRSDRGATGNPDPAGRRHAPARKRWPTRTASSSRSTGSRFTCSAPEAATCRCCCCTVSARARSRGMRLLAPLGVDRWVVAYDRPGFGLTERPMPPYPGDVNPYSQSAQVDLLLGLMDKLGIERAVLVGNSAGGTISLLTALEHPERVAALVLVDPAVYVGGGGAPGWASFFLNLPQVRRIGPLFVRNIREWGLEMVATAWHDPSKITAEVIAGYTRPLQADDWDRALWELTISSRESDLPTRLGELDVAGAGDHRR